MYINTACISIGDFAQEQFEAQFPSINFVLLFNFLRTVWYGAYVLLLSLAPQGFTIGLLQLLSYGLVCPQFSSVHSLSRVWLFVTPWTAAQHVSLSITNSWNLLKLMSIESLMPSNHLTLCHSLLLPPSIFSSIRVFLNEAAFCNWWPKYWSFSSISTSNEYSGLITFRMNWLDLLAAQRTLKSLLQHYSSKASILWCSAFFIVQLSHPYMTTGKKNHSFDYTDLCR